ncbi:unnamed protein product [Trichobilharzia regenti]|nr:unnamed protein product [Trichobilharzia regenti]
MPPLTPRISTQPVDDGALINLNWSENISSKFRNVLSDGTEVFPCGACGYHPTDCTYNVRNWGSTRSKSKRKNDGERLLNLLGEFTGMDDTCGFNAPTDEPFWPWLPSLFADLDVPTILKFVDTPQVVNRRSVCRRSARINRSSFYEDDSTKKSGMHEMDSLSDDIDQGAESRDTDSILKDIRQQNLLDTSVSHRSTNQRLQKEFSSFENKENVINRLSSHVSSSFTPRQTVVVRRIRGILKQCGSK